MMYKGRVGSYLLGFAYLLKLASLHCFEDEHCISHGPLNNSIKMDPTFSKDQANISDDKKHIRKRNLPELSLLSSNHSVQYLCTALQDRTYEAMNLTQIEKSVLHCINSSSPESLTKTLGESVTISIPSLYKSSNYSTSWYKDCKEYVKNRSEISFESLKQADSAVYMYTITHMYNAKNYSACRKRRLIVKGKNYTLTCEAFGDTRFPSLYWTRTNKSNTDDPDDILDPCNPAMNKTCMGNESTECKNSDLCTDLHLINVSDDDIKYPYKCHLRTPFGSDIKLFVLKLKEKSPDISRKVFTTSIIASVTCSVSVIFLIGLCILFRIQIVLLYRSITGVDETIGDGKEYDAYLSFESSSTYESNERHFAFHTLAPILENCFGYKLFIFERDVVPGGALVDDMNSFLEKSRRLIVILNKSFTSCKAMYELESGLHKAMVERKIKVILIEFTPLSEQGFQLESLQLLKMKNRVKWKGNKSSPLNSEFWKKMQYLMPVKPIKLRDSSLELKAMQTTDDEKV
ncbi:interleukin-18 receptor 1-like [Eleutherodactylus coqui]|uniref:interleukin-18 receptor 1-like n=1 Tax=Eleutherodactylus coqui TaxID=57060 RepID=UPI003463100A